MAWTKTYSGEEPQRVNKWLAQAGVCSRREAEDLIARGLVSIDGEKVSDPGRKIARGQTLTLSGGARAELETQISVVLHKPIGFVSGQPEPKQIPAIRLVRRENVWGGADCAPPPRAKLAPLGRLDLDSRGLLLLSEDGVLAKALIGPDSRLDKEYLVRVQGGVTERKLALLRRGLTLDGRALKEAVVEDMDGGQLRFVLREGRNRQIRRMCELVNLAVTDLFRVRIGPLKLGDLPEGRWRPLTAPERDALICA